MQIERASKRAAALLLLTLAGCAVDDDPSAEVVEHRHHHSPIFDDHARPLGISMDRWGELAWKWIFSQPAATNPLLDQTGVNCGVGQNGPVWFLPSIMPTSTPFTAERSCTIPRHKMLLVQTSTYINDFPCPDPAFHPAPGQSLYDFLLEGAAAFIDTVNLLEVSIDGVPQPDMLDYRYTSRNLFSIKGDLSLQAAVDGCITGNYQPAITDGYLFMVKPLPPGQHTLVWHLTDTFGMTGDTTLTYHLTVQ